jgi:hypothetical protein
METLVHKTSTSERNLNTNPTSSHIQYTSMSNTNAPAQTPQVVLSQPAPISKAAKPVRDSAQFVSEINEEIFSLYYFLFTIQVDLVSAVLFPVAFIVFNIIYW